MTYFLDVNQIAECCQDLGLEAEESSLVDACNVAAKAIAAALRIKCNVASNQPGFGGLCVGFSPAFEGQQCPLKIAGYDDKDAWENCYV